MVCFRHQKAHRVLLGISPEFIFLGRVQGSQKKHPQHVRFGLVRCLKNSDEIAPARANARILPGDGHFAVRKRVRASPDGTRRMVLYTQKAMAIWPYDAPDSFVSSESLCLCVFSSDFRSKYSKRWSVDMAVVVKTVLGSHFGWDW